ncbi:MAG: hypothetical protein EPN92_05540 [Chitinophagaceae bacterium]|nr:MAG: hypothetical protein EPN92_05540 [Chitinophagaceae bacterium]
MKYNFIKLFLFVTITGIFFISCGEEVLKPPALPASSSFVEEFDTVGNLGAKGWVFNNNSEPAGISQWTQGLYGFFPAYSSNYNGLDYASCNYTVSLGLGLNVTISSWMITKPILAKNGDQVSFYTRTFSPVFYPDRLQFRANLTDDNPDVGLDPTTLGNFTTLIADINPNLTLTGYPQTWTKISWTVAGLPANTTRSIRFAFRYYFNNTFNNGYYIGVDKFEFISN